MMLLNSLVVALRQLRKSPGLAVLNIAGLAIGISTFLLLIAYLRKETSYDVHHNKPDQLYRVVNHYRTEVEQNTDAWVPTAIAEYIQHEGTKTISQATRLFRYRSPVVMMDPASQKYFTEENSVWADANLFEVFTFNFISGNNRSLELPHSMVVSESTALKYFGTTDVRGKSLTDVTMGAAFTISGVVRDLPSTSHFKADFICALSALPSLWGNTILNNWGNSFSYTYVRTDADPLAAAQEINALASKFIQNTEQYTAHFSLQRVTDIHLHSHVLNEWTANSDIKYVYILFAIAALILGVTIVNYINLWIARSHQRTREIGIRQAVGGSKSNLTAQFAMESVAQITLAVLVSAVLIQLCAPFITEYLGDDLLFTASGVSFWIACFFGVVFFIALVMLYPSKVIASIRPAMAIKGQPKTAAYGITLWQTLIGFQVVVTACLITAALLIRQQVSFIQERPLGYNDAQLINVSEMSNATNYRRFKEALLQNSRVTMASGVSHALGGTLYQSGYEIADRGKKVSVIWQRIHTDHDYCKTYSIPIVAGRDFSRNVAADTMNYLVNEAACRALGYENPEDVLGLEVNAGAPIRGKIIGVMKDFHFKSLHNAIEPLILHIVPDRIRFLTVRIEAGDFGNTIRWIDSQWKHLQPEVPFVYAVLNDARAGRYAFEQRFSQVILIFTIIVVMLSANGLISLNVYLANLQRREFGIRKILGATTTTLLLHFSRRFVLVTAVGFLLSVPLSWYAVHAWLSGFAYKVDVTTGLFMSSAGLTLLVTLISITLPSWKVTTAPVVNALKVE